MGKGYIYFIDDKKSRSSDNYDVYSNLHSGFVIFKFVKEKISNIKKGDKFYYSDDELEVSCGTYQVIFAYEDEIHARKIGVNI